MRKSEQKTLTEEMLAKRWFIRPGTLKVWRSGKNSGPPYIKLGCSRSGKVVYRLEDIEAYELKQRVPCQVRVKKRA